MGYGLKDLGNAANYAFVAHLGQVDGQGKPYVGHPYRVARMVGDISSFLGEPLLNNRVAKIVAILHDVVEDSGISFDNIREDLNFGDDVIDALRLLTRQSNETYSDFIDRIVVSGNIYAIIVKIADIVDNLDPNRVLTDRQKAVRLKARYELALTKLLPLLNTFIDIDLENF